MNSRIQITTSRPLYDSFGEPVLPYDEWKENFKQQVYIDEKVHKIYTDLTSELNKNGIILIYKDEYKSLKEDSKAFNSACDAVSYSRLWIGGNIIGLVVCLYDLIFNVTHLLIYFLLAWTIIYMTAVWLDFKNFKEKMKNQKKKRSVFIASL